MATTKNPPKTTLDIRRLPPGEKPAPIVITLEQLQAPYVAE